MNHTNAIDELSDIRDKHLHNAAIAHAEMRLHDRDTELDYANSLSETIRQLQGIVEPELPGLEAARKTNPFLDRALTELKRDAWNVLAKSPVGLEEVPFAEMPGPTVSFVPVLEPTPKTCDYVVPVWFNPASFGITTETQASSRGINLMNFKHATAHIYLDKPAPDTTVPT